MQTVYPNLRIQNPWVDMSLHLEVQWYPGNLPNKYYWPDSKVIWVHCFSQKDEEAEWLYNFGRYSNVGETTPATLSQSAIAQELDTLYNGKSHHIRQRKTIRNCDLKTSADNLMDYLLKV